MQTANIVLTLDEGALGLGAIQLNYTCDDCSEIETVTPMFFEESNQPGGGRNYPVCFECGADMRIFSATVNIYIQEL